MSRPVTIGSVVKTGHFIITSFPLSNICHDDAVFVHVLLKVAVKTRLTCSTAVYFTMGELRSGFCSSCHSVSRFCQREPKREPRFSWESRFPHAGGPSNRFTVGCHFKTKCSFFWSARLVPKLHTNNASSSTPTTCPMRLEKSTR